MPQLGNVNLTIELKDRMITADATPLQAAVIELFDKQGGSPCHSRGPAPVWSYKNLRRPDTWTAEALQQELRVGDAGAIRNALYFWNNLGVLGSMADDMWRLLEERAAPSAEAALAPVHGEFSSTAMSVSCLLIMDRPPRQSWMTRSKLSRASPRSKSRR